MTGAGTDGEQAAILSLGTKFWRVQLERDPSGNDLFLAGGWSRFLAAHGIAVADVLLLRLEGNTVFTVKVFGLDGCQKTKFFKPTDVSCLTKLCQGYQTGQSCSEMVALEHQTTELNTQQEGSSGTKRKNIEKDETESIEITASPPVHRTTSKKKKSSKSFSVYVVGPPSWLKKEMSASSLTHDLVRTVVACNDRRGVFKL